MSVDDNGGEADNHSDRPAISGDGRFTAFSSAASNLVQDDTNGHSNTFFYDRLSAVGGIAELPDVEAAPLQSTGLSGISTGVLAGIAGTVAAGTLALAAAN